MNSQHAGRERKGAQPQRIEVDVRLGQPVQRLVHRRAGGAEVDDAVARLLRRGARHRLRHQRGRGAELGSQPLHVAQVVGPGLGIARVFVARRAAREDSCPGGVRAGQRAPGNAVAIDILVAAEVAAGFELFGAHHLAAVEAARIVPGEGFAQPLVHADVQVGHHEHRRLQPVGQVQRRGRMLETFVRVLREQQHMLGVAVRGIGAAQDVGLLRARGHAGGRPAALHVDDGHRDLGKVGQADELGHQADTPGPEVAVKARAPFQPAPVTMPIEAISSSACTMA